MAPWQDDRLDHRTFCQLSRQQPVLGLPLGVSFRPLGNVFWCRHSHHGLSLFVVLLFHRTILAKGHAARLITGSFREICSRIRSQHFRSRVSVMLRGMFRGINSWKILEGVGRALKRHTWGGSIASRTLRSDDGSVIWESENVSILIS